MVKPGSWWTRFNCIRPVAEIIKDEADEFPTKPTGSTSAGSVTRAHEKSNNRAGSKTPIGGKRGLKSDKGTQKKSLDSLKKNSAPSRSRRMGSTVPAENSKKPFIAPVASEETISKIDKKVLRKVKKVEAKVEERTGAQKAITKSDRRSKAGSKSRVVKKEGSVRPAKPKMKTTSELHLGRPETDEKRVPDPEHNVPAISKSKRSKVSSASLGKDPKRKKVQTAVEEPVVIKDELLASDVDMADSHTDANGGPTRKGRRTRQKKQEEPPTVEKGDSLVIDSQEAKSAVVDPDVKSKNQPSDKEIVSITAGKGTLARTRQFRQALMQRNAGHEDDVFESTPYIRRQSLRRQIVEEKLFKTPAACFARRPPIFTPSPSAVGFLAPDSTAPPIEQSPDILKPYDASAKEGYVHALKSRRQGVAAARPSVDEKKRSLVSTTTSSSARIDRDLQAALAGERGALFRVARYHDGESEEEDWESEV